MIVFFLFIFVKMSIISINYTSLQTKLITNSDKNKIRIIKNVLELKNDKFVIPSLMFDDTIYNTLEMLDANYDYVNTTLKKEEEQFCVKHFETKVTATDLNGKFLGMLGKEKNFIISVRDYYSKEQNEELFKAIDVAKDTNVTIIPASLSVIPELITKESVQKFCILSTAGSSIVCNIYEVTNADKEVNIKTVAVEKFDLFGDSCINNIIEKHVRDYLKNRNDKNVVLVPLVDEYEQKDTSLFLDITGIVTEINEKLAFGQGNCPCEEPMAVNKINNELKKPIENIVWNYNEIRNKIRSACKDIDFTEFTSKVSQFCKDHEIDKKFIISSYNHQIYEDLLGLDNVINVQDLFILKGAIKFNKQTQQKDNLVIKTDDTRYFSDNKIFLAHVTALDAEIKIKNEAINTIAEIKEQGDDYLNHLPKNSLDKHKEFINSGVSLETLKFNEAAEFVNDIVKLKHKNSIAEKDKLERPKKIFNLEEVIAKVNEALRKNPDIENVSLKKKLEECKVFLENNRESEDIIGANFDDLTYALQGILDVSVNRYESRKRAKKAKKDEETTETNADNLNVENANVDNGRDEKNNVEGVNGDDKGVEENNKDEGNEKANSDDEKANNNDEKVNNKDEKKDNENGEVQDEKKEYGKFFDHKDFDPEKLKEIQNQVKELLKNGKFDDLMKNFEENKQKGFGSGDNATGTMDNNERAL